ncbi:MAG: hypothetical protein ABIH49_02790, partial [archaeon]
EYQCKSLGQACEIVNKGTNEEKCTWVNRNDVNPPVMEAWRDALIDSNYNYVHNDAILPPDRGVKVLLNGGEIPAFTPLQFGVKLNEIATCKIDALRKDSFEEMSFYMSSGIAKYNHSYSLILPNVEEEGIQIQNDGTFEAYVRCQDANGNENIGNFVFKYQVQRGPDTTAPLIVSTSIPNNEAPISFGQVEFPAEIYLNEPVTQCRWSHSDRGIDTMEETMDCSKASRATDANAQGLYTCKTTLTGLKDRFNNEFYFRCEDKSGNVNQESEKVVLVGTQPLVISSASPDGITIKDSTSVVKVTLEVETSAGYDEGAATCYFSDTGNENDYVAFLNTDSYQHSQELHLSPEVYTSYILCRDLGGNTDNRTLEFTVESDNESPKVARAYKEENYLKLITNENAQCVYDTTDCNYLFDDGTKATTVNGVNHFINWDSKINLYVKCMDDFGNQPNPDECSIIARATD